MSRPADFLVGSRPFTFSREEERSIAQHAEVIQNAVEIRSPGYRVTVAQQSLKLYRIVQHAVMRAHDPHGSGN